jgi:glycosyltransferase involved in cell wall biosynthesis
MGKFKLSPGFVSIDYGYALAHQYLGDKDNIGVHGENLTIVVISCNRSALTVRLLDSLRKHIPDFKGDILLFDNASDRVELRELERKLAALPFRYRLFKSNTNYGPAGGRNRAMKEVRTEWIMSLDNDVYFTGNPLEICRRDISALGCKFLNIPLLSGDARTVFANGGSFNVFKEGTDIHIWPGSMYEQISIAA